MHCIEYATRFGVKFVVTLVVADAVNDASGDILNIDMSCRTEFAGNNDLPGGDEGFTRDFGVFVLGKIGIHDSVRNLVCHFIGVPFRN